MPLSRLICTEQGEKNIFFEVQEREGTLLHTWKVTHLHTGKVTFIYLLLGKHIQTIHSSRILSQYLVDPERHGGVCAWDWLPSGLLVSGLTEQGIALNIQRRVGELVCFPVAVIRQPPRATWEREGGFLCLTGFIMEKSQDRKLRVGETKGGSLDMGLLPGVSQLPLLHSLGHLPRDGPAHSGLGLPTPVKN